MSGGVDGRVGASVGSMDNWGSGRVGELVDG